MTLKQDDLDSVVIKGLYLNYPDPVTERRIAAHYKLDPTAVHEALLRLRQKRIARDRRKNGERVWESWR